MKEFWKGYLVLGVLLIIAGIIEPYIALVFIMWTIYFSPVFLIEAIALEWLFKGFYTKRAIFTSTIINVVTIVVFMIFGVTAGLVQDKGVGMGVTSLIVQLLLLKLIFKATLSIRGISAFVFAHIVFVIWWNIIDYWMAQQPLRITTG